MTDNSSESSGSGDFVILDVEGNESKSKNRSKWSKRRTSPYRGLYRTPRHQLALVCVVLTYVPLTYFFIKWQDIAALWFNLGLLLLQLAFAVDKLPLLRLHTQSYFAGPALTSTLEETTQKTFLCRHKACAVVQYDSPPGHRPVLIRKTLLPSLYDDDFVSESSRILTIEGYPFSAFPEAAVVRHHQRFKSWLRYLLPLLLMTIAAVLFNLYVSNTIYWGAHKLLIEPVLFVYAILAPLVLLPLLFKFVIWKYKVMYDGEEVSTVMVEAP